MKTNVQPGMLARVVRTPKTTTDAMVGRIVFVERDHKMSDVFHTVDGISCRWGSPVTEPTWVISAKTPLPFRNTEHPEIGGVLYFYERPVPDANLRPLLDPGLDVSDQEVRELFAPSFPKVAKMMEKAREVLTGIN